MVINVIKIEAEFMETYKQERRIINLPKLISAILGVAIFYIGNIEESSASLANRYDKAPIEHHVNNEMGTTIAKYCALTTDLFKTKIEFNHPDDSIAVDIGSGLGGCTKVLSFLGYQVHSIDLNPAFIQHQQENFCNPDELPPIATELLKDLDKEMSNSYCQKLKKKQVFIAKDFSKIQKTELPDKRWDYVVMDNVLQFMPKEAVVRTLELVKNNLSDKGVARIAYTHLNEYNFNLKNYQDNYSIIINEIKKLGFNTKICEFKRNVSDCTIAAQYLKSKYSNIKSWQLNYRSMEDVLRNICKKNTPAATTLYIANKNTHIPFCSNMRR